VTAHEFKVSNRTGLKAHTTRTVANNYLPSTRSSCTTPRQQLRSPPRSNKGVASDTTVVCMTAKCGPGGGSTPTLASSAPHSIAHTGPGGRD
jgi:hypothetical protein